MNANTGKHSRVLGALLSPRYFGLWNAMYVVPLSLAGNVLVSAAFCATSSGWPFVILSMITAALYAKASLISLMIAARQQELWEFARADAMDEMAAACEKPQTQQASSSNLAKKHLKEYGERHADWFRRRLCVACADVGIALVLTVVLAVQIRVDAGAVPPLVPAAATTGNAGGGEEGGRFRPSAGMGDGGVPIGAADEKHNVSAP